MDFVAVEGLVGKTDGAVAFFGFVNENLFCFGMGLANDDRDARFDDTCLFVCDFGPRVTQELHVVEINVGDDAQFRRDEVGGIQSSAHAHLDDGDVDLFFREVVESHAHGHLKEGELHLLKLLLVGVNELYHILLWNHLAVDADAFAEVAQVGRGVKASLETGFLKHGSQHVGDGTFAVGARHMHRLEVVLGVVEKVKELDGVVQISLVGGCTKALIHRELVEHPVESLLVGHMKKQRPPSLSKGRFIIG